VCITTNQPDTKSNPNPNPNSPNPTTKQHSIVNIPLNTVTCPTYPEKFIRDNVIAPLVLLSSVIVTLPQHSTVSTLRWDGDVRVTGSKFCKFLPPPFLGSVTIPEISKMGRRRNCIVSAKSSFIANARVLYWKRLIAEKLSKISRGRPPHRPLKPPLSGLQLFNM